MIKKTVLLIALLPIGFSRASASDPRDFNVVVADMVTVLQEANKTRKPQRLAVITFISTKQIEGGKNDFGEYLTESFISAMGSIKQVYKLFERKRLDVVLKENDFMLSDLVNQSQAQKLGELLPIDVIFSGTYHRLKSYVDINGRLIDVVTGEILASFSGRIKMTADLESLFPTETASASGGGGTARVSALDLCRQKAKALATKLNDLSSEDKVQGVVDDAVKIPFDVECGAVHFDVMAYFRRYKIENNGYRRFLLAVVDTIPFPGNDDRSIEIFTYLAKDGVVDAEEWKAGMKAMKRMGFPLRVHLRVLLAPRPLPDDLEETYGRIDGFFRAVRAGEVGLPTPLTFTEAFFFMTNAVKVEDDVRLQYYAYDKYGRAIEYDKKTTKSVYELLASMYKRETDRTRKTAIVDWIAGFFNTVEDNEKAHEQLYEFVRSFEMTSNKTTNEKIRIQFPESDLAHLVGLCKNKFAAYALLTPYTNQKEDRINFCVKWDIPLPGTIPTMAEANTILKGDDLDEQKRVTKLLELMGPRPAACEAALVGLLQRKSLDRQEDMKDIQESAIVVLGHIHSADVHALDFMITSLTSFDYGISDKAADALTAIGKPGVGRLIGALNATTDQDGGLRYKIIKILGRIGKDAAAARPSLQNLLQKTSNKDVRYIIEAALQAME